MLNSIQEFAAHGGRNRYGLPFEKLHVHRQIVVLMDVFGKLHKVKNKEIGSKTKRARHLIVHQFINDISDAGFYVKNILNLDQRHIKALISNWIEKDLSPATLQTRFSTLRWLAQCIGKAGLVLSPESYGVSEEKYKRTYVATTDKSWTAKGQIPAELIGKATEKDAWVGIHLEMMNEFGLRVRESVLIRPAYSDSGHTLLVEEGTKGGRTRAVQIETPHQRDVLDRAKKMAEISTRGALVNPGKTAEKQIRRIYYVCELLGITKGELGVTPHGLRHGYANDRYEEVSGMPSAVRGQPEHFDREADERARNTVTRELGHARLQITTAYTGARVQGRPPLNQNQPPLQDAPPQ